MCFEGVIRVIFRMLHVWKVLLHGATRRAAWITSVEEENKHPCLQAFQSGGFPAFSTCVREITKSHFEQLCLYLCIFHSVQPVSKVPGFATSHMWWCGSALGARCPSMGQHGKANLAYELIETQSKKWAAAERPKLWFQRDFSCEPWGCWPVV